MIPNTCEKMPNQEFRENRLWCLEVDDLLKANLESIDEIFMFAKTGEHTLNIKQLMMSDLTHIISEAGFTGVENTNRVGLAYSLSKQTIIDDMVDFENYENMTKVEFFEFLGRAAELLYENGDDEDVSLVKKLGRFLTILIEKYTK